MGLAEREHAVDGARDVIAFWLFFLLLAPVVAQAGTASTNLSVNIQPPASSTLLPTPPSGFHWVQTFADEFSTTFPDSGRAGTPVTLDNTVWGVDHYTGVAGDFSSYSPPTYGSNSVSGAYNTVSGGVLSMGDGNGTGGENIINTTWTQQYGYFVYNAKLPGCSGDEFDLESFGAPNLTGGIYGELAWQIEQGACNYTDVRSYEIDQNHNFWGIGDTNVGVNLTQAFHQYGLWWVNDGSAHGSVTIYFDGNVVGGPYQLKSPAFDSGLYFDIFWTMNNNAGSTMQFDWVRAYQLAPG